jgi:dephospho-CoA kinase
MLLVGLTGGIGSGKSTVAQMLEERGAVVLDADLFARQVVRRGTSAHDRVVARFGLEMVKPDGELDRPRLASTVFADLDALRELEDIVHPEVRRLIDEGIDTHASTDAVVVLVNPLLIEMGAHRDCDIVVVVSASQDTQVTRTVARGMDESDVRARMAAQMSLDERVAYADVVLDNEGSLEELAAQVDHLWSEVVARVRAGA